MTQDDQSPFLLGDILVSPPHNKLSLQGRTLSLQPKVMAVLCYLARHSERVVSNDELLDQVWQGRVVTHASVQKSMNTLRNALAELAGEREFVAHFSKRGYQLVVPVRFVQTEEAVADQSAQIMQPSLPRSRIPPLWLTASLVVVLIAALLWLLLRPQTADSPPPPLAKHHVTAFTASVSITEEGRRERYAEPHPDGKRIAYVRDLEVDGEYQSQIVIRGPADKDWLLAGVEGTWVDLAWSPSGRNLVATELRRAEGLPRTPDYFEKPNNLYTFHIFTLDFRGERLLEKNLLSQWQGVVASVTWWDDNTLEFVASLGPGSLNERYRYLIAEQRLSALNTLNAGFVPLQSVVHNKVTAVVSRRRNTVQLEFLDAEQKVIITQPLSTAMLDISWIPDGTGVLILEKNNPALYTLDLRGETFQVQFPLGDARMFSHPRYSPDGQNILLTTSKEHATLTVLQPGGSSDLINTDSDVQRLSLFVPTDGSVVYTSERHGEHALWHRLNGKDTLIKAVKKPLDGLILAADANTILYSSGGTLWKVDVQEKNKPEAVWENAGAVEPILYLQAAGEFWFVRRNGDARNVWRRNLSQQEERQITFGSVGTVMALPESLYFQYSDQPGLWRLDNNASAPVQISKRLPANSKLLHIRDATAFFVSGGPCRESDLQSLNLPTDDLSVVMERQNEEIISHDFHPLFGVLQTDCKPVDSELIKLISSREKS